MSRATPVGPAKEPTVRANATQTTGRVQGRIRHKGHLTRLHGTSSRPSLPSRYCLARKRQAGRFTPRLGTSTRVSLRKDRFRNALTRFTAWRNETFQNHVMSGLKWALDGASTKAYGQGLVGNASTTSAPSSGSAGSSSAAGTSSTGSATGSGASSAATSKSAAQDNSVNKGAVAGAAGVAAGLVAGVAAIL